MLERLQEFGAARQDPLELLRRPREGEPFDAFGVRVLSGGEPTLRQGELAQHVLEGPLGDLPVARLARHHPRVQVDRGEERVVVQHLLEVRDEPSLVHRVAVEAAADQVVHPAGGHPVQGLSRPSPALVAAREEELEAGGGRELRRAPEPAPLLVELAAEASHRVGEQRGLQRLARRLQVARAAHVLDQLARGPRHVRAPFAVRVGDCAQHLAEARQPMARLRREVRPAEERLTLGSQEHGHRPAAVAGQCHDRVHVHRVEVGPLLAVDLDVHERSFISSAVAWSSKDSCSITWHQWQAE